MFVSFDSAKKRAMIASIQEYVSRETGEEIGEIAAEIHLEFIMDKIAPYIYNEAIKDARTTVEDRLGAVEDDLYALERPLK